MMLSGILVSVVSLSTGYTLYCCSLFSISRTFSVKLSCVWSHFTGRTVCWSMEMIILLHFLSVSLIYFSKKKFLELWWNRILRYWVTEGKMNENKLCDRYYQRPIGVVGKSIFDLKISLSISIYHEIIRLPKSQFS